MKQIIKYVCCVLMFFMFTIGNINSQIINGDFEQGKGIGWTEYNTGGFALIGNSSYFIKTDLEGDITTNKLIVF